jgi:hypothetical protein
VTEADALAIVCRFFDGTNLQDKSTRAASLLTTAADGWPNAAMISVGELVIRPDRTLGLATWSRSRTTANARRTGCALLHVILDGHAIRVRMRLRPEHDDGTLTLFSGEVLGADEDIAAYASLTSGPTFVLHDAEPVLERWAATIARLQAL